MRSIFFLKRCGDDLAGINNRFKIWNDGKAEIKIRCDAAWAFRVFARIRILPPVPDSGGRVGRICPLEASLTEGKGLQNNLVRREGGASYADNWSHINFLGEYSFQSNMALGLNEYRPLKV